MSLISTEKNDSERVLSLETRSYDGIQFAVHKGDEVSWMEPWISVRGEDMGTLAMSCGPGWKRG